MNFLIFDNDLSSAPLINALISDFHHVKLFSTHPSVKEILSSSSLFLSIQSGDVINASQVLQSLSKHGNDPIDAVLIVNLSMYTGLNNIAQALQRITLRRPPLFLVSIGRTFEVNANLEKIFKESKDFLQWTIVNCNELEGSTGGKYRVAQRPDPTQREALSGTTFAEFLRDEVQELHFGQQTIYLYFISK